MRIPFVSPDGCSICGREISSAGHDLLCEDCEANPPAFDRAASAFRFEGKARQMLLDYKFNGHLWLKEDFIDFLEAAARARFDVAAIDLVVPVPLTLFHRLDRGYNQSAYLAQGLAKRLDRRCDASLLGRAGSPRRQSGLHEDERRRNVEGTFAVRHPQFAAGRTILVVDDTMTTGATLSECARSLKAAGAWRVFALSLAKTIRL